MAYLQSNNTIQPQTSKQRLWEKSLPLPCGGPLRNLEDHLVHCSFHSQTHWSDISDQSEPSKEAREPYPGARSGLGLGLEAKNCSAAWKCFWVSRLVFQSFQLPNLKRACYPCSNRWWKCDWAVSARAWAEDEVRPPKNSTAFHVNSVDHVGANECRRQTNEHCQCLKRQPWQSFRHSRRNKYLIVGWPTSCALKSYLSLSASGPAAEMEPEIT